MRKRILFFSLALVLAAAPNAHATLPTFDAVNAALQEIQNSILDSSFAQDIMLAVDHLNELKTQTLELLRFHAGLDEILHIVMGDPVREFIDTVRTRVLNVFSDSSSTMPALEILQTGGTPEDLRASLETITGNIPEGNERAYIPFEEMQVVEAFDLANQIRENGTELRDAARQISEQAEDASPKGAVRLQAQGISELMVLGQQSQESIAKMLELQATQIEQVSRREKDAERERLRFIKDTSEYLDSILASSAEFSHE